jgi:DNA repair protein RecO
MVYETYETDAFSLSARNLSEGNRLFNLFTRDFGLVRALAQNIRGEKSKLRYSLQVFSRSEVALVRGKEYWRVIGAKNANHFFVDFKGDVEKMSLIKHLLDLVSRLVQGEGANRLLFLILENTLRFLAEEKPGESFLKHLELVTVARMLFALGYFSPAPEYRVFFRDSEISKEILEGIAPLEKKLLTDINAALSESHL